nr:immunoglobulin light chain junction region [Macaca mulatta]MOX69515.1 immunoglobulin light chain junction region [Macaca mulatta]MOX69518.1 immunoglobulin light chain junction region [Macaca mulatta]MOX69715.1 immunoglobulin light chain junction region [Macaca mulatta]MOX69892.1 immunoglobulin light chain junction region [Macaca mulatta]
DYYCQSHDSSLNPHVLF